MNKYIIIRAEVNGGKTTTAGLVFEELKKSADFFKIFDYNFNERDSLEFNDHGSTIDFIAIIIIDGVVIIIISQGDVAEILETLLNKLLDKDLIKRLTDGLKECIDIYVCCARSRMRKNSTIEILYNRSIIPECRREFWTKRSEKFEDRNKVKKDVVKEITDYILSKVKINIIN